MARTVDKDAKRLKILEASTQRFAHSGFEATSMEDLALAAGVSKGSLYDYFHNKEDLFYACFEWFEARLLTASLERLTTQSDAKARLIDFADTSVAALKDNIALYPVMLEVWAAAAKSGTRERFSLAMRTLYAHFRAQISTLIRNAQSSGDIKPDVDAEAVAGIMIGAVDGLLLQYWLDPTFDPRAWVKSFMNSLFTGIGS